MELKKKKLLNIPEQKGLIHNFSFQTEIPFPPVSFPKTLHYQLDGERHTRQRMLNSDVKGMFNLFVSCDLGFPLDDLNMKPHLYNLREGYANVPQILHPDDQALIDEEIIVSDTEDDCDNEAIRLKEEQRMLEQKIKDTALQLKKDKGNAAVVVNLNDHKIDYSHSFDTLKIAIHNTFTASAHQKVGQIKHPSDTNRKAVQVFDLIPNNITAEVERIGVVTHKQRIEGISGCLEKVKFCSLYKDLSFQGKNQNLMRLFVEKPVQEKAKNSKVPCDDDGTEVEKDYTYLFQNDPEVVIEEASEELTSDQFMLKNKSVFSYTNHSTKLQANDQVIFFEKNCDKDEQKATYQKVEFQYSLDQEKRDLTFNQDSGLELPRYVTMEVIDEDKVRMMKKIDEELVEEEYGQAAVGVTAVNPKKSSMKKQEAAMADRRATTKRPSYSMDEEDDDEEEEGDDSGDMEKEDVRSQRFKKTKSYNLRESRNETSSVQKAVQPQASTTTAAKPVSQTPIKQTSTVRKLAIEDEEDSESSFDIFEEDLKEAKKQVGQSTMINEAEAKNIIAPEMKKTGLTALAKAPASEMIDEDDSDEEFQFRNVKGGAAGTTTRVTASPSKSHHQNSSKKLAAQQKDNFINDNDNPFEDSSEDSDPPSKISAQPSSISSKPQQLQPLQQQAQKQQQLPHRITHTTVASREYSSDEDESISGDGFPL